MKKFFLRFKNKLKCYSEFVSAAEEEEPFDGYKNVTFDITLPSAHSVSL